MLAADGVLAPLPRDVKRPLTRIGYLHLAGSGRLDPSLAAFLAEGLLAGSAEYVLWGYGATGKALRRALLEHG